jgi:hypothetical protein
MGKPQLLWELPSVKALCAVNRYADVQVFVLPILFILSKYSCRYPPNPHNPPILFLAVLILPVQRRPALDRSPVKRST